MIRALLLVVASAVPAGCADEGPGRLGPGSGFDAGGRPDGSTPLDGGSDGTSRPDGGPILPASDRVVVLPLGAPNTLVRYEVDAEPAMLDVHLAVDTTGSFLEEIAEVQRTLAGEVVPKIRSLVSSSSFGISYFQDFPTPPYGGTGDLPFALVQRITSDVSAVSRAVYRLDERIGNGGDVPESGFESIYQVAKGTGYSGSGLVLPRFSGGPAVGGGTIGGVGYRADSFRVLVHATDAVSHDAEDYLPTYEGTHGADEALAALASQGIYFVGVTNGGSARADLVPFALATHAYVAPTSGVCLTGIGGSARAPVSGVCPLVFDILPDGTGLSSALESAVAGLVSSIDFDRVIGLVGEDRLDFVQGIVAADAVSPPGVPPPAIEDSTPGDGLADSFVAVRAGTRLSFDVVLRNDAFASQTYEQSFRIRIRIRADTVLVVDEWIRVVVPAIPG